MRLDATCETLVESLNRELFSVLATDLWQKWCRAGIKTLHCCYQRGDSLLREKYARGLRRIIRIHHSFQRASSPKSDHWRATSLRLDRGDAEILFSRKDKGSRTLKMMPQYIERLVT